MRASIFYAAEKGEITVENSTISGNTANDVGGGVYNDDGFLELNNSTVSGNTADNGGSGIVTLSSTITISYGGGSYYYVLYPGGTEIRNTIIAANDNNTDVEGDVEGRFNLVC
ncbi:MAG: hypothetical protein ACFB4I_07625 [Cyanophyceae cyanobacterium]